MLKLIEIHADIDARVQSIRASQIDWPCSKGCDRCCQRLAEVPRLTEAEWILLREGLAALSVERLAEIRREIGALTQSPRPLTCPLLERASGVCPVYHQRPVACRTYGFYVQRDLGLYCSEIEVHVTDGELSDVVWGNQDAVERELAALGKMRSLVEWFGDWDRTEQGQ